MPWEAAWGGINTATGNKTHSLQIAGWTIRGGMPLNLALYHNSEGTTTDYSWGSWTPSCYIKITADGDNRIVRWGDGSQDTWTLQQGLYARPVGVWGDTLAYYSSGPERYELTKLCGTVLTFTQPNTGGGWFVTKIVDTNGNEIDVVYDSGVDRPIEIKDVPSSETRNIQLCYDGNGHLQYVKTRLGDDQNATVLNTWTFVMSSEYSGYDLTQLTLPSTGSATYHMHFVYDSNHRITSIQDPRHTTTTNHKWQWSYNSDGSCASFTDATSNVYSLTYAAPEYHYVNGLPDYDIRGTCVLTDPRSNLWKWQYYDEWDDQDGYLRLVVDPTGTLDDDSTGSVYTWDTDGTLGGICEHGYRYHDFGSYSNGQPGSVSETFDTGDTHYTHFTYNALGEVTSVKDNAAHYKLLTYDTEGKGNLIAEDWYTDQGDPLPSPLLEKTYSYPTPNYGLPTQMTVDPKRSSTTYVYRYTYDDSGYGTSGHGDLTSYQTPLDYTNSRAKRFTYNAMGVCNKVTNPDGSYVYASGMDYWYRPTQIDLYNAQATRDYYYTCGWDACSNLTSLGGDSSVISETFAYNYDNQITQEYQTYNKYINYSYSDGLLHQVSPYVGAMPVNNSITYTWRSDNRVSSVEEFDWTTYMPYDRQEFTYFDATDPNGGQLKEIDTFVNDGSNFRQIAKSGYTYYVGGALKKLTNSRCSAHGTPDTFDVVSQHDYRYDGDGLATTIFEDGYTDQSNPASTEYFTYAYNALHQLTNEYKQDGTGRTYDYTYDLDGAANRWSKTDNSSSTEYDYSYNEDQELTSVAHGSNPVVTDSAYEYDQNGRQNRRNLGTGSDYDLVYDALGQLRKIKTHGTSTVLFTYAYDGLGRRYSRKVGTNATQTTLNELGLVRDDISGGSESADYGYGLGLFRRNAEFAVWDGQGDLRNSLAVDGNYVASVVSTSVYDAFGNRVSYDNSSGHGTYIPNQYCGLYGYRKDGDNPSTQTTSTGDAGLMHVGARWYDAATGGFFTTDPTGLDNPFTYCGGDPVNWVDPTGLWRRCWEHVGPEWRAASDWFYDVWLPAHAKQPEPGGPDIGKETGDMTLDPCLDYINHNELWDLGCDTLLCVAGCIVTLAEGYEVLQQGAGVFYSYKDRADGWLIGDFSHEYGRPAR